MAHEPHEADPTSLKGMLLEHLASVGLGQQALEEVTRALQASEESALTSNLTRVYKCAMEGQLCVRASLLSGRECSVLVSPWTTVAQAQALLTSELGVSNEGYRLASAKQALYEEDFIGMHFSPTSPPLSLVREEETLAALEARLARCSPTVRKQVIGEMLYPKIAEVQPKLAGKITGMVLEMTDSELIVLLRSHQRLLSTVDEALRVLHAARLD
ncbi:PAB1 [Symbiodinium natans]|uniref:PAB1 protein n=1 Tax=Symbiodinium natans TaxID=878477 RepID=A0A812H4N5_9DINO|nr:PAB1 [Symbiodinium natans]